MSQKEFASFVPDCNILTLKEVGDMMRFYNGVLTTPLPFLRVPRSGPLCRCCRFREASHPSDVATEVSFACIVSVVTSKTIYLHGVQLFGSEHGEYNVSVQVLQDETSLLKQSGTYVSQKNKANTILYGSTEASRLPGYGFDVLLRLRFNLFLNGQLSIPCN